jgi:4-diphosphocytidyl-2-C-methyl-D-erythritol kinase
LAGPDCLTRTAWAKVNLYLHVIGRRADGYHDIDSLIVFAGVGDRLVLAPAAELTLRVEGPFAGSVPAGEENLVLRAARRLAAAAGVSSGASIVLHKALPAAAGLGGGSADAAAVLNGLAGLWELAPGEPGEREALLAGVARGLGADLPVCRFGRPAFVGGIGQTITRAPPLPAAWLVLVNCGLPLPTAAVYHARVGVFSSPGRWTGVLNDIAALAEALTERRNDLEAPALALAPAVAEVLARLKACPGVRLARLSGSGATCFGLFGTAAEAEAAAGAIAADRPDWWVAAAPMLHGPVRRPWEAQAPPPAAPKSSSGIM